MGRAVGIEKEFVKAGQQFHQAHVSIAPRDEAIRPSRLGRSRCAEEGRKKDYCNDVNCSHEWQDLKALTEKCAACIGLEPKM